VSPSWAPLFERARGLVGGPVVSHFEMSSMLVPVLGANERIAAARHLVHTFQLPAVRESSLKVFTFRALELPGASSRVSQLPRHWRLTGTSAHWCADHTRVANAPL